MSHDYTTILAAAGLSHREFAVLVMTRPRDVISWIEEGTEPSIRAQASVTMALELIQFALGSGGLPGLIPPATGIERRRFLNHAMRDAKIGMKQL